MKCGQNIKKQLLGNYKIKTVMITKYFQKLFALSEKGAKDLNKGIIFSTLLNLTIMLPAAYLFFFLMEYLEAVPTKHTIWYYLILAVIIIAIMFIICRLQYNSTYTTIYDESAHRRISLAEKLRKLPLAFFGEKNLSDLTSTIMEDCSELEHTFSHSVPQLFASCISLIIISICMFIYNWEMSLALFWVVPLALLTIIISRNKIKKGFVYIYNLKRYITEDIQEGIECIQEIKSYNGEEKYEKKLAKDLKLYENELKNKELSSGVFVNISAILLKLGMPSVMLYGAYMFSQGQISLFVYLAFLIVSAMVFNPVLEVCTNMIVLSYLDVRIDRMKEMEAMPVQGGDTNIKPDNYDIKFTHVGFAYEKDKQVLKDISFTAKQGKVTALVGPSGGGKSTTAKLAARFWDINSGTITLGGKDISRIEPETLLKNYAIVFQDVILFNASVKDNIRIGKLNATDEEIIEAAKSAQCDDFIKKLPNGYDTVIGENGSTLSGGERQRISIARALLKNAPVILLDEATASLDAENETKVQAGISELVKDKTVIIIAHRMRTVRNADHIVVIDGGVVSEQGRPEELIEKNGEFARMIKLQQDNN